METPKVSSNGWLLIKKQHAFGYKKRFVRLEANLLSIFNGPKDTEPNQSFAITAASRITRVVSHPGSSGDRDSSAKKSTGSLWSFLLEDNEQNSSNTFAASTSKEREDWLNAVLACIQHTFSIAKRRLESLTELQNTTGQDLSLQISTLTNRAQEHLENDRIHNEATKSAAKVYTKLEKKIHQANQNWISRFIEKKNLQVLAAKFSEALKRAAIEGDDEALETSKAIMNCIVAACNNIIGLHYLSSLTSPDSCLSLIFAALMLTRRPLASVATMIDQFLLLLLGISQFSSDGRNTATVVLSDLSFFHIFSEEQLDQLSMSNNEEMDDIEAIALEQQKDNSDRSKPFVACVKVLRHSLRTCIGEDDTTLKQWTGLPIPTLILFVDLFLLLLRPDGGNLKLEVRLDLESDFRGAGLEDLLNTCLNMCEQRRVFLQGTLTQREKEVRALESAPPSSIETSTPTVPPPEDKEIRPSKPSRRRSSAAPLPSSRPPTIEGNDNLEFWRNTSQQIEQLLKLEAAIDRFYFAVDVSIDVILFYYSARE